MSKLLRFITPMALLLALTVPLSADRDGALAALQRALDKVNEYGYHMPDGGEGSAYWIWNMNPGYYNQVNRTFYRGNDYALVATGDNRVLDVDLKVYDENWNLIDSDTDETNLALVRFTPKWTGAFHIRTIYYSGRGVGSLGFFIAFKR